MPANDVTRANRSRFISMRQYPDYFSDRQSRFAFRRFRRRGFYPEPPVFLYWIANDWDVTDVCACGNGYAYDVDDTGALIQLA
jgi:hypothetical protein